MAADPDGAFLGRTGFYNSRSARDRKGTLSPAARASADADSKVFTGRSLCPDLMPAASCLAQMHGVIMQRKDFLEEQLALKGSLARSATMLENADEATAEDLAQLRRTIAEVDARIERLRSAKV